jgi:hypothetical protein
MTILRTITGRLLGFCALSVSAPGQTLAGTLNARAAGIHDRFGEALAISEQLLVVGSPGWEPSFEYQDVGAVYVFGGSQGGWVPLERLAPNVPDHHVGFGSALAVQGSMVAVGSPTAGDQEEETGVVYLFKQDPSGWHQSQVLGAATSTVDDRFGTDIDFDGEVLYVGAPRDDSLGAETGRAYVYRPIGSIWREVGVLSPPSEAVAPWGFGHALAADGGRVAVGAPGAFGGTGCVYIFESSSTLAGWQLVGSLQSSGAMEGAQFGAALAMHGDWLAVGSPGESSVELFELGSSAFESRGSVSPRGAGEGFGGRMAMTDNQLAVCGGASSEAVWLFARSGSGWVEVQRLANARRGRSLRVDADEFGADIALSNHELVIGAPASSDRGRVDIYSLAGSPQVETTCWGTNCPCGNLSTAGGCMNSSGSGARLSAWGALDLETESLRLVLDHGPSNRIAILVGGARSTSFFLGDGIRCVGPAYPGAGTFRFIRHLQLNAEGGGELRLMQQDVQSVIQAGRSLRVQALVRDPGGPCGAGLNTSNGIVLALRL